MRSHPRLQPLPLIKFEDLSLAMFSQIKFNKQKIALSVRAGEIKHSPHHQAPTRSSPTIYG
jgi:hypothetical protein